MTGAGLNKKQREWLVEFQRNNDSVLGRRVAARVEGMTKGERFRAAKRFWRAPESAIEVETRELASVINLWEDCRD